MTAWSFVIPLGHMQDYTEHTAPSALREPASRKEREKRAREMEILKAARELFVSKGFRETTLEEIAHHAEFGKGTLYNYFASKEDLFLGILDQTVDEIQAIARASVSVPGEARQKLLHYARAMIQYVKDHGELLHVVYQEMHRSDSPVNAAKLRQIIDRAQAGWEMLAQPLLEGIQNHSLRPGDAKQLIVLFDGIVRGYCFHQFVVKSSSADTDVETAAEFVTSVFFDGITEKTQRITLCMHTARPCCGSPPQVPRFF